MPISRTTKMPPAVHHVRLFRNGCNQALRIPRELELPSKEALLQRESSRLIIQPPARPPLLSLLRARRTMDQDWPDAAAPDCRLARSTNNRPQVQPGTNALSEAIRQPQGSIGRRIATDGEERGSRGPPHRRQRPIDRCPGPACGSRADYQQPARVSAHTETEGSGLVHVANAVIQRSSD